MLSHHTQKVIFNLYSLYNKIINQKDILLDWIIPSIAVMMLLQYSAPYGISFPKLIISASTLFTFSITMLAVYDHFINPPTIRMIEISKKNASVEKIAHLAAICFSKIISNDIKILNHINPLTVKELFALNQSFSFFIFQLAAQNPPQQFDPRKESDQITFLQFLKLSTQIDQLLTLVKLGARKEDCHIAVFEEADARTQTKGNNSLVWLAAKAVNKYGISLPKNAPPEIKEVVKASKKYSF